MLSFIRKLAPGLLTQNDNITLGIVLPEPTEILILNRYGFYSHRNFSLEKKLREEVLHKSAIVQERLMASSFTRNGTSSLLWQAASYAAKNLPEEKISLLPNDIQDVIGAAKTFVR